MSSKRRFDGIERFVWEALNGIGRSIGDIEADGKWPVGVSPLHSGIRDRPVWHNKHEVDLYVCRRMGLNMLDYGSDMSKNPLYKAIANEIGKLRRAGALVDWRKVKCDKTGIGVWKLDKTRLGEFAARHARREIRAGNYYSAGREEMVYVREKQKAFRTELLKEYGMACALCKFRVPSYPQYMIGAHIVPYSVMRKDEPKNSMNPSNGLLLCRFCDTAFEHGSIRVFGNYDIKVDRGLRDHRLDMIRSWTSSISERLEVAPGAKYRPKRRYLERKIEIVGRSRKKNRE